MRPFPLLLSVPLLLALSVLRSPSAGAAVQDEGLAFSAGPQVSWFSYEEPGVMEESGLLYGVSASCSYREADFFHGLDRVSLEASISGGSVDYSSTGSGDLSGIDERMYEIRLLAAMDLLRSERSGLSWFTGIGYRRLDDSSGGMVSTRGYCGYDRHSNYWYSPIGLEYVTQSPGGWSITGVFEYDAFLGGTQVSELTDADNAVYTYSRDLENSQTGGYGLRAAVVFRQELDFGAMSFGPFFRYWNIDRSDVDTVVVTEGTSTSSVGFVEPANNSSEYGMAVSVSF